MANIKETRTIIQLNKIEKRIKYNTSINCTGHVLVSEYLHVSDWSLPTLTYILFPETRFQNMDGGQCIMA